MKSAAKSCRSDFQKEILSVAIKMTVKNIIENEAECIWWDGSQYCEKKFPVCTLIISYKGKSL